MISSDLTVAFVATPVIVLDMVIQFNIYGVSSDQLFNTVVFLAVVAMGYGIDIINYLFLFLASKSKDRKYISYYYFYNYKIRMLQHGFNFL
jgi:hypothetical protein